MEKSATEPTGSKKFCGMTKNNKIMVIAIIAVVILAGLYWQKHTIKQMFFKQNKTSTANGQNKSKKSSKKNNNQNTQDNTGNAAVPASQTPNQSQDQNQTNSQNAAPVPDSSATSGN